MTGRFLSSHVSVYSGPDAVLFTDSSKRSYAIKTAAGWLSFLAFLVLATVAVPRLFTVSPAAGLRLAGVWLPVWAWMFIAGVRDAARRMRDEYVSSSVICVGRNEMCDAHGKFPAADVRAVYRRVESFGFPATSVVEMLLADGRVVQIQKSRRLSGELVDEFADACARVLGLSVAPATRFPWSSMSLAAAAAA